MERVGKHYITITPKDLKILYKRYKVGMVKEEELTRHQKRLFHDYYGVEYKAQYVE